MSETLFPLWTSLRTAFVATMLATCLGVLAAQWMLSYSGRLRGWIDGIFTLPLVLPPTVVGFLLLLLLGKGSATGQLLDRVGISIIFTWAAAVIAATVVAFPLVYKTVLSAFEQVDRDLIESAQTLGASERRVFWQILLPLAWPGLVAGIILAFARALGEFGATLMVGGSIPGVTQTMPIAIYFAAEAGRMESAIAWTLVMIAISLVVIAALNYGNAMRNGLGRRRKGRLKPLPTQTFVRRLFNGLYLGQFQDSLSAPQIAPTVSTQAPPAPRIAVSYCPELFVQIRKQLPQFELQLQLHVNHRPLGVIGASGSGKSMTLRCIAGLETPDEGKIVLNGRVLFDSRAGVNVLSQDRRVGIFFQNYALFPHLSVAQNIAFGMHSLPRQRRAERVFSYLAQFGLEGLGDRYPHQISGGQQQRVALARVLASQPDVLLLDEPLSALDTYLRSSVERLLIKTLSDYEGVTLFVTHKLEEVYRVCANLAILDEGKLVAAGSKVEIFAQPPTVSAARVTECKNFSRARKISDRLVEAMDWGCQLKLQQTVPEAIAYVGVRAHHIRFLDVGYTASEDLANEDLANEDLASEKKAPLNAFPGWLAAMSETQHRVTLFIKLHSEPTSPQDYHLQAEVYRDKWMLLKQSAHPWTVQLAPENVIAMLQS